MSIIDRTPHFGDDLIPRLIDISELTFNLSAANARLSAYVSNNEEILKDRAEPVYRSQLRNGIPAYWYQDLDISQYIHKTTTTLRVKRKLKNI
ncbi:MAG: hypothetical protein JZU65_13125 [Chlorobium sp.]|nr:hypothetical protein [Chlorobium sp.]